MLSLVGNLSEKGLSFFQDQELRYELYQDSEVDIIQGSTAELFIGVNHRTENNKRYGKILSLEENVFSFMVDVVEEVEGTYFRNYDNIESITMETIYDSRGFLRNILSGMMSNQVFEVFEFITRDHISRELAFQICANEDETRILSCRNEYSHSVFSPDGWWGSYDTWPPSEYYNFYTDFFYDKNEDDDRISIYDQWRSNEVVNKIIIAKYIYNGFHGYNYINNVYPEQTEIIDYRWHYGGYDITWNEYKVNTTYIHNTFRGWYGSISGDPYFFIADEKTVKGYTDIAKTNTRRIFERDEHILEELLGPKECVSEVLPCRTWQYGNIEKEIILDTRTELWLDGEDGFIDDENIWPEDELAENNFVVYYSPWFESLSKDYVNSQEFNNLALDLDSGLNYINDINALYSIELFDGKIGNQFVYNKGLGNEHRYFMSFKQFLSEQGWSLDDFMLVYDEFIALRIAELEFAVVKDTHLHNKDYSEFYDKNHKAPFDGINFYTPMIPTLKTGGTDGSIRLDKRTISIDEFGNEIFSDIDSVLYPSGSFTASINKDEFVYSVAVLNSLRTIISDFMRIKMTITFKDNYPTSPFLKLRVSASDFTFLNEREFIHHG